MYRSVSHRAISRIACNYFLQIGTNIGSTTGYSKLADILRWNPRLIHTSDSLFFPDGSLGECQELVAVTE
jgi:hypothetical protein